MLSRLLLGFANHLLGGEDWARNRLKPFAGQHACIGMGPFSIAMTIAGDGSLSAASGFVVPDVSIHLPDDAPGRLMSDPGSVFAAARLSGKADFAEALGFVFRNLRWDPEADLARLTGDVVARRVVSTTASFAASRKETALRVSENFSEYVADELGWIVRPATVMTLNSDVTRLHDDLLRLEARISRLEHGMPAGMRR